MTPTDRELAVTVLLGAIKMASLYMDIQRGDDVASSVIGGSIDALMVLGVTQEEIKTAFDNSSFLTAPEVVRE
jgi:hypothetical protein